MNPPPAKIAKTGDMFTSLRDIALNRDQRIRAQERKVQNDILKDAMEVATRKKASPTSLFSPHHKEPVGLRLSPLVRDTRTFVRNLLELAIRHPDPELRLQNDLAHLDQVGLWPVLRPLFHEKKVDQDNFAMEMALLYATGDDLLQRKAFDMYTALLKHPSSVNV